VLAPRLLLGVLALLATAVAVATGVAVVDAREPPRRAADQATIAPRTQAVAVLADWDRRRSAAWAAGDGAALTGLYAPGSTAGRRDVAMLERWRERGLRVSGLRMQVLAVEVRERTEGRWDLLVTDRLGGGVAVGPGTPTALPRDEWSTRRIVLVRVAGEWRVETVSAVSSGPAPS
jgi:hypothetical protein